MWRYTKAFIAGTVSAERDGVVDCVAGAEVALSRGGAVVAQATTDAYGDFKIDRLEADGSTYEIRVTAPGYVDSAHSVALNASEYAGDIRLAAA